MRFNELKKILDANNIFCSDEQLIKFNVYYDLLIDWNNKINLTAITEPNEVMYKHFYDSITPAFFYNFSNENIIDIGAGAGFPSIPLKICFPELKLTLLDSLNKRILFLEDVVNVLKLDNMILIHGRAEDIAKDNIHRQKYDIALSRAVAKLNVLTELSLPFLRIGGTMISLKGANIDIEIKEAKKSIDILGGELIKNFSFKLPEGFGDRNIIQIKKSKTTPIKYPRKSGIPSRNPLK